MGYDLSPIVMTYIRNSKGIKGQGLNGSVGFRNVDQNINKTFPGIKAKDLGSDRLKTY